MKKIFLGLCFLFLILCPLQSESMPVDYKLVSFLNTIDLNKEYDMDFLLNFHQDMLKILLNAFFARHGRPFRSREIRNIFQHTTWYKVDPRYTEALLTPTDKNNIIQLRNILLLTPKNRTWLFQVKRIDSYSTPDKEKQTLELVIDKKTDCFIIRGRVNIPGTPWDLSGQGITQKEKYDISLNFSFTEYGPEKWFINHKKIYFFVDETIQIGRAETLKIRKYLSCVPDYNAKQIKSVKLITAITEEF